ncbi:unnamed protein product [Cyprideis torosa]|uniref:Nucleotidyl transferase domain-containing protein n=1 Tax=Cyprideis torosa TaxID=163714 RepID=A0A7R8WDP7_9CRUS|nr:unnamed protein product [Cyprideis torosa]CAG0893429.1 unnamed protein product [Cyprideis torosa]
MVPRNVYKAIILIGGPQKGTRFRPFSLDLPKPLFPVAGIPILQHHVEACSRIPNIKEILVIGFYQHSQMSQFVSQLADEFNISIRYLQEFRSLGTAGGLYHFRDQILAGSPSMVIVINGDVCADFPLDELIEFHASRSEECFMTVTSTESTRSQSQNFGCLVIDPATSKLVHFVDKPSSFISCHISCGVYACSSEIFDVLTDIFRRKAASFSWSEGNSDQESMSLESDVLSPFANSGRIAVFTTLRWWSQVKTPAATIYANRHYLTLYQKMHPERLPALSDKGPVLKGLCFIHPKAKVHATAVIGPNVSIGPGVVIGAGARILESIILRDAVIQDHAHVRYSIVGWDSTIGEWSRVEGTPDDPNPNRPFAKMENKSLFDTSGKLNPSISILGSNVQVPPQVIVLNSIVLPYKELSGSVKNEIIL